MPDRAAAVHGMSAMRRTNPSAASASEAGPSFRRAAAYGTHAASWGNLAIRAEVSSMARTIGGSFARWWR